MYDESYDNYIRSILGYPMQTAPIVQSYPNYEYTSIYRQDTTNRELEECYPEIYKIIFPMVTKTCNSIQEPVTRELVEKLTDNIYFAIEGNDEVNVNINLTNEIRGSSATKSENNRHEKIEEKAKQIKETRSTRNINRSLRDLIKILLLRELIGRPGNRPSMRPPRPPFPGGPGPAIPPRPPMRPRTYEDYNIYEI